MERITNKGNSSLILELSERISNSGDSAVGQSRESSRVMDECSRNVMEMTTVFKVDRVRQHIEKNDDFFEVDSKTEVIEMDTGLCNDLRVTKWNLSVFPSLTELVIGDECVCYVNDLVIVGFAKLIKISIGSNCFVKSEGRMEVSDCGALRSVMIGGGSCVNWCEFVMKNCKSVEEVSIGDDSFVNCENTVFESGFS